MGSKSSYLSPLWLKWPGLAGGHAQTIIPALLSYRPRVRYRRERWESTPGGVVDGDFIDVDFVDASDAGAPMVVMFHGLEGSSDSHYALAMMKMLKDRGWAGAVPHFRGCSGEPNRILRAYHSGDAAEIDWILKRIHQENPKRLLYVCGVSLGGNALLVWLASQAQSFVKAAAAISAPLNLAASGAALEIGFTQVYTYHFLRTMKKKALLKLTAEPARKLIREAKNLHDFDDAYTAPVHGFRDADDYWSRASSQPLLRQIRVPTLILNAKNDPFLPRDSLPGQSDVSEFVTLDQPEEGGHVGFTQGFYPGRNDWLPARLLQFFDESP